MRRFLNLDNKSKRILKNFLIFFGLIFGMAAILVIFSLAAGNSWKIGLAVEVQSVLYSYPDGQYTVGKNLELKSALSTSSAVYSLIKKDERKNEKYYGIIVRIPSVLGPLPAVFIYNDSKGVSFAGYAVDNGKAEETVDIRIANSIMSYWEEMIPKIIEKAEAN